jgi:hypothetical protein
MRPPLPRRLLPALGLLLAAGCGPSFTEYTSAEGRFSVRVPATPHVTRQEIPGATVFLATVEQPAGRYVVGWMDIKTEPGEAVASEWVSLGNARDSAVRSVHGSLLSDNKVALGDRKYPGLDLLIELPGKESLTRERMYLVNGRLYQVMVTGRKWWVESADTPKFLDSFRLVE